MKLEYLTLYLSIPMFSEFLHSLYPEEGNQRIRTFILYFQVFFSLLVIFLPPIYFSITLSVLQINLLLCIVYAIYILVKAFRKGKKGVRTFLLGFFVFASVIVNDILYNKQIINTGFYTPIGVVAFIFSQALLLSSRFAYAFHQVKDLSDNLEKKVEDRTKDLEEQKKKIIEANLIAQQALKKSNDLNEMIQLVIQSKNIDEMFLKIYDLFKNRYGLTSYLMYVLDTQDNYLKLNKIYGNIELAKDSVDLINKNHLSIEDKYSIHGASVLAKRSILLKKVRLPHPYMP
jgi:hypothetical protein